MKTWYENKIGRKWVANEESVREVDAFALKWLVDDLLAKKVDRCTYIKSIKCKNNYDGTHTITINYIGDVRRIWIIYHI